MGQWSRAEIEEAFADYQRRAAAAGACGDWRAWADQFTEDATYIEHHYGTFQGREAIHRVDQLDAWPSTRAGTCRSSPSSGT